MNIVKRNPYQLSNDEYEYLANQSHITSPSIFGPGRWDILHSYAKMCYTREDKEQFAKFVYNVFTPTIKCLECQNHFKALLLEYPVPFGERLFNDQPWSDLDSPFKWAWKVHNLVNKRLNKKQMSFETCLRLYDTNSETCNNCFKPMN